MTGMTIGGFKGVKGAAPPKCATLVLADYTGNWEITNEVLQVKHLTEQLLCRLYLACPPKIFSRSAHGNDNIRTYVLWQE